MNKNTIIDTIKYNYVNEFKSLGYNLTKDYPSKWNKNYFIDIVDDVKKNIKPSALYNELVSTVAEGLNLNNLELNTYQRSLDNLKTTDINILNLEDTLKSYIDYNKDYSVKQLEPVNALNNSSLTSILDAVSNGFEISPNVTKSFLNI